MNTKDKIVAALQNGYTVIPPGQGVRTWEFYGPDSQIVPEFRVQNRTIKRLEEEGVVETLHNGSTVPYGLALCD